MAIQNQKLKFVVLKFENELGKTTTDFAIICFFQEAMSACRSVQQFSSKNFHLKLKKSPRKRNFEIESIHKDTKRNFGKFLNFEILIFKTWQ